MSKRKAPEWGPISWGRLWWLVNLQDGNKGSLQRHRQA